MWRRLSRDDQDMIKKFNGGLRRKRERDSSGDKGYDGNRKAPITRRRNPIGESEPERQMTKADKEELVRNNDFTNNEYNQGPEEEESKSLTMHRDLIRFKLNE